MNAADRTAALDERVRLERIRMFFGLAKGNMAGILLGILLIGSVLLVAGTSTTALALWTLLMGLAWLAGGHAQSPPGFTHGDRGH